MSEQMVRCYRCGYYGPELSEVAFSRRVWWQPWTWFRKPMVRLIGHVCVSNQLRKVP